MGLSLRDSEWTPDCGHDNSTAEVGENMCHISPSLPPPLVSVLDVGYDDTVVQVDKHTDYPPRVTAQELHVE